MHRFESVTKPAMWSMALLMVALMAGCWNEANDPVLGTSVLGGIPGAPAGAIAPGATCVTAGPAIPKVNSSIPVNGDQSTTTSTTGVAGGGKSISANFSLVMNAATINSNPAGTLLTFTVKNNSTGNNVAGTVAMDAAVTKATFTTSAALSTGTSYTAIITQAATSGAGTPLSCIYAWNFSTAPVAAAGVNLGLVAPFAIGSAGGMTNGGFTKLNGDVVLDPNQTCNAAPVGSGNDFGTNCNSGANKVTNNAGDRVITQIFPDTTTADQVMSDLNTAWQSISPALLPGATVLGCGTIGTAGGAGVGIGCAGNATLPAGTYISASGSSIDVSGDLTLDAANNSNARWVFQAPSSTVITAVGSRILLINGAKASNVWWYVGSSATLNATTTFQGNILASASISMGVGSTSCGRLLAGAAGAGAFSFLGNTVSVPGHPSGPVGCQ